MVQLAPAQGLKLTPAGELSFETLRPGGAVSSLRRGVSEDAALNGFAYSSSADPTTGEAASGFYLPLSARLSTLLETSHASGIGLTTEWSMLGQVGASLGAGWAVNAGLRHSELGLRELPLHSSGAMKPGSADIGMVTLERYWDRYRGSYTFFAGRADSGANTAGHRVQFDYFYGAASSIGLAYTMGQPYGASTFASSWLESNNIGLTGEHWFTRSWAFNYNALVEEPRNGAGLRPELRVGLRLRF
jgi:hypothetical protein